MTFDEYTAARRSGIDRCVMRVLKGIEMGNWANAALTAMTKTLLKCRAEGKTPADTAKAIDDAYPFGEREHHPYKVWLRERKLFFAQHGLPRNGRNKTDKEQLDDLITMMSAKRGWAGHNAALTGCGD